VKGGDKKDREGKMGGKGRRAKIKKEKGRG